MGGFDVLTDKRNLFWVLCRLDLLCLLVIMDLVVFLDVNPL